MRRGGIEPPAPRRCWMATENFTTKPSARFALSSLLWIRVCEARAGSCWGLRMYSDEKPDIKRQFCIFVSRPVSAGSAGPHHTHL
ncbi:hypothetical protein CABS03_08738 [Colletotrichum abscissum]|uniref:Uncharacterized protein n=1 Tax=Colletotrichum abscissum TaxID=1671311 RepID=A0A9Q0B242_9PEZI|nr:hypothetical protein CABS02_07771 [Colletotrichum abscissum]